MYDNHKRGVNLKQTKDLSLDLSCVLMRYNSVQGAFLVLKTCFGDKIIDFGTHLAP